MPQSHRRYSKEEFARRGDAIYEREIGPRLEKDHLGQFAAIDVETGEYEIDDEELAACNKLRRRLPDAQVWLARIGSRHAYRFGGNRPQAAT